MCISDDLLLKMSGDCPEFIKKVITGLNNGRFNAQGRTRVKMQGGRTPGITHTLKTPLSS